jgi:hypothetical protein
MNTWRKIRWHTEGLMIYCWGLYPSSSMTYQELAVPTPIQSYFVTCFILLKQLGIIASQGSNLPCNLKDQVRACGH